MRKKILWISIYGALSLAPLLTYTKPVITLFLYPYPIDNAYGNHLAHSFSKPGKIAKVCLRGIPNEHINGIIGLYHGYVGISDSLGQLTFPRAHEAPTLTLLVTTNIIPTFIAGTTIHHWNIDPHAPTIAYTAEQKQDPSSRAYFWDIKKIPFPEDKKIPRDALVIVAKPKNVHIPEGITLTDDTANLVLPPIYIKKGIDPSRHALKLLNLRNFFSPLRYDYKKEPQGYEQQLIP